MKSTTTWKYTYVITDKTGGTWFAQPSWFGGDDQITNGYSRICLEATPAKTHEGIYPKPGRTWFDEPAAIHTVSEREIEVST